MASDSSCSGDITITTAEDGGSIADCDTWDGNITISSDASGSLGINGVTAITGNLRASNATQLTSVSADALSSVEGTLYFGQCTNLSALQFQQLTDFNRLGLISLPALQILEIGTGTSRSDGIDISDTGITSLNDLGLETVKALNINNNRNLTSINMNTLQNVTNGVSMAANNPGLTVSFPNLASAANLTAMNISSLDISSLIDVSDSLGVYTSFVESISAPNLTRVGADLSLVTNARLLSLDFPALETIGGRFLIADNTKFRTIDNLDRLETVGGALDFWGDFDSVSLSRLSEVGGSVNVTSSSTNQSLCDEVDLAARGGVIKGQTSCQINGILVSTGGDGSNSTSAPDSSDSTPDSGGTGLGGGTIAGIIIGALILIAAAISLWWFYQRKRKSMGHTKPDVHESRPVHHELASSDHREKAELHGGAHHVSELPGKDAGESGARGRCKVKPGLAEMDSTPMETKDVERSSSSTTITDNQSTSQEVAAKQSDGMAVSDSSGRALHELEANKK